METGHRCTSVFSIPGELASRHIFHVQDTVLGTVGELKCENVSKIHPIPEGSYNLVEGIYDDDDDVDNK